MILHRFGRVWASCHEAKLSTRSLRRARSGEDQTLARTSPASVFSFCSNSAAGLPGTSTWKRVLSLRTTPVCPN